MQDAWAALDWAAASTAQITGGGAGPPLPLIVAGESAGGNLAAVVARRSAERGGPGVLLQVLICPVTDSDTGGLSYTDPANQLLLDRDEMIWFWDQYVPDPAARRHPDASPLQAVFFNGVPPAVILTAEHDVLRDEGELYAMRLVQAGVPAEHRRFAGQIHGLRRSACCRAARTAWTSSQPRWTAALVQHGPATNPPRLSDGPLTGSAGSSGTTRRAVTTGSRRRG